MSKIVALEEYKGTFLEKCYISKSKKSEITPETILSQLNSNLEKGLITQELHDKAVIQLNSLIEKGGKKEMIGHITVGKNGKKYKKVAEGKWMEVSESHNKTKKEHESRSNFNLQSFKDLQSTQGEDKNRRDDEMDEHYSDYNNHKQIASKLSDKEYTDEEVGVKGGDFSENKVKEVDGFSVKDKVILNRDVNLISLSNLKNQELEVIGFVKTGLISKPEFLKVKDKEGEEHEINPEYVSKKEISSKHISDMSKEEKHSMAEKMGISGHKEMTEKELSKQLIERKIDNELKGKGSVKELNNNFNIIKKELREKGYSENFQIYSSVEKENNLKNILKTPKGKEFIKLLKDIPLGVKISQSNWANEYIRNEKGFLDKFSNKILSINNFALNRISDNSTTGSEMKFEEPIKKSFEDNINILKGEQLEGGLGDNLSVEDIAKKHKVSKETIENQLEIGIEVEMEHTNDKLKAKEIVLDHLTEASDYYTKLSEMEKK